METNQGNKKIFGIFVCMVFMVFGFPGLGYTEQMSFAFTGHVQMDQTLGLECTPFDSALLYYPFRLTFELNSERSPDEVTPYGDNVFYMNNGEVKFSVGEKPYPVSELEFIIGEDYLALYMGEYSGFLLEYIWGNEGIFSDGSLLSLCDVPGEVRTQPVHKLWSDFGCWGPVISSEISVHCGLPWVKQPFIGVNQPGTIQHPDVGR